MIKTQSVDNSLSVVIDFTFTRILLLVVLMMMSLAGRSPLENSAIREANGGATGTTVLKCTEYHFYDGCVE